MTPPALVLLHAFPLDSRMWARQRPELGARGFTALAPDLPGDERRTSLGAWAEQVLALVDGPLVPVGVSMGGYVALELCRRAPERVAGLVLADTRASADTAEGRAARDEMIHLLRTDGVEALWERMRERLFAPAAARSAVEHARSIVLDQPPDALVAALEAMRERPDASDLLASIDVPALVVVGEEDALTPPSEGEALADALPHARLVRIAGSGHLPPLERPDDFDEALLAFLRQFAP